MIEILPAVSEIIAGVGGGHKMLGGAVSAGETVGVYPNVWRWTDDGRLAETVGVGPNDGRWAEQ
jgi:hypothetical protein